MKAVALVAGVVVTGVVISLTIATLPAVAVAFTFLLGLLTLAWLPRQRRLRATARKLRRPLPDRLAPALVIVLPTAIGSTYLSSLLAFVLLAMIAALAVYATRSWTALMRPRTAFLLAVAAMSVLIFGTSAIVASMAAVATFCVTFAAASNNTSRASLYSWCARSIEVYLAANLVAYYALGLRSSSAAGRFSGYESALGIVQERIFFPLASSLIVPAVFAAAYLCWSVPALLSRCGNPIEWLFGSGMSVFFLLAADYRVPMAVAVALLVFARLLPRHVRRLAPVLALVALALPFWWNDGGNLVAGVIRGTGNLADSALLSRDTQDSSSGLDTLSNRTFIWEICRDSLNEAPPTRRLIGFGYQGQIGSGANVGLNALTQNFVAENASSAHNSILQTLLDGGFLATAGLVAFIVLALADATSTRSRQTWRPRWNTSDAISNALLPVLAIVVSGATEVTIAPGIGSETYWLFFLISGIGIITRAQESQRPPLEISQRVEEVDSRNMSQATIG